MTTIPFPDGGKGVPPERRKRIDVLIDEIFMVLPTKTLEEIREKIEKRGTAVSVPAIEAALAHLRRHSEQYGWSVPHVKRGSQIKRCYFAVLVEKDGTFVFDAEYRAYAREGFKGTLGHISTMGKNEVTAMRIALQYIKSKVQRDRINEIVDDLEYVAKKARSALKQVNGRDF